MVYALTRYADVDCTTQNTTRGDTILLTARCESYRFAKKSWVGRCSSKIIAPDKLECHQKALHPSLHCALQLLFLHWHWYDGR